MLALDYQLWATFQAESAARKLTASSQVEDFMRKKLDRWQKEKTK